MKGIIRKVEVDNAADELLIDVNNHNRNSYEFRISTDALFQPTLLMELGRNKVLVNPIYDNAVRAHLLYGYYQCDATNAISYQNSVLGWYPFGGQQVFFYDTTHFNGNYAETSRKNIKFSAGSKDVYLNFLKETVFPSVELSLALSIGYSAVVASRLSSTYDLGTIIVNLCGISSTGKSTAEMLMCSPFACPEFSNNDDSLCFTANSTQNALFSMINGIHGVPFVVDDITTNKTLNLTQMIYDLSTGNPKARCNGDGTLRDGGYGWSGIAITSSETSILDSTAQNQGLKVRVLHTQGITWTKDAAEAELVKRTVRQNYGWTGKDFALYVASIPYQTLCDKFDESCEVVKNLMQKKDALTSRLANKFAVIHLTVELLNEAFQYGLSAKDITERIVKCEQDSFEERDNAKIAYDHVVDFIAQNSSHFDIDVQYSKQQYYNTIFAKGTVYGKIYKFDDLWKVYLSTSHTDALLMSKGLDELKWIRKMWVSRGITEGDTDHNNKRKCFNGTVVRCDVFTIKGGIVMPTPEIPKPEITTTEPPQNPPVSDYSVDDSAEIDKFFGGDDED